MVADGVANVIGMGLIRIKKPAFSFQASKDDFRGPFDYAIAQSIFSHCGEDLIRQWLSQVSFYLKDDAAIVATFLIGAVLVEPDTVFETYSGRNVVTAQNLRFWEDWYVWELFQPHTSKSAIAFVASDKLLASCKRSKSVYAPIANGEQNIFCNRSFVSDGLSIKYSFGASGKVPHDIPKLDHAVLSAIKG